MGVDWRTLPKITSSAKCSCVDRVEKENHGERNPLKVLTVFSVFK